MSILSKAGKKIKSYINKKADQSLEYKVEDNKFVFGENMDAEKKALAVFKYLEDKGAISPEFLDNQIRGQELLNSLTNYYSEGSTTVTTVVGNGAVYFSNDNGKGMITAYNTPKDQPEIKQYVHLVTRGSLNANEARDFVYSSNAEVGRNGEIVDYGLETFRNDSYTRSIKAVEFNTHLAGQVYVSDITTQPTGDVDSSTITVDDKTKVIRRPEMMVTDSFSIKDENGNEIDNRTTILGKYPTTLLEPLTMDQSARQLIDSAHEKNLDFGKKNGKVVDYDMESDI